MHCEQADVGYQEIQKVGRNCNRLSQNRQGFSHFFNSLVLNKNTGAWVQDFTIFHNKHDKVLEHVWEQLANQRLLDTET